MSDSRIAQRSKDVESTQGRQEEEHPRMDLSLPPLPFGCILDVNESLQILSLLVNLPSGHPCMLAEQQFTDHEWCVLVTLMKKHPDFASYALLLAQITGDSREECHERLKAARRLGNDAVKRELRPLREALSTMQPKLKTLYLKVASLQTLGYRLASDEEDM